jgi:hypothetical protein
MSATAADLAEYETLTLKSAKMSEELRIVEARRDELRRRIIGNETVSPVVTVKPVKRDRKNRKRKPVQALTAWERINRTPTLAINAVVEVVKMLGRATNQQVASALNMSVETASLRLSTAARQGWLRRVAQGVYEVAPLGGVMVPAKEDGK